MKPILAIVCALVLLPALGSCPRKGFGMETDPHIRTAAKAKAVAEGAVAKIDYGSSGG